MMRHGVVALAAALLVLSPVRAAAEEGLASDILACAAQPDEKAQLACYNAIAARLKAAQASAPAVTAPAAPPPAAASQTVAQTPKPEGGAWYNPSTWFGSSEPSRSAPAATAVAPPAAVATAPQAAPRANTAAEFGSETLPATASNEPARVDEITAKVATATYNYFRRFTVTLDNGQVWRQLESDGNVARFSDDGGETITIKRGWLGFVLSVDGKWFQVKRLR